MKYWSNFIILLIFINGQINCQNLQQINNAPESSTSLFVDPIRRTLSLWGRLLNRMAETNPPTDDQLHLTPPEDAQVTEDPYYTINPNRQAGSFGNFGSPINKIVETSRNIADKIIDEKKLLELLPRLRETTTTSTTTTTTTTTTTPTTTTTTTTPTTTTTTTPTTTTTTTTPTTTTTTPTTTTTTSSTTTTIPTTTTSSTTTTTQTTPTTTEPFTEETSTTTTKKRKNKTKKSKKAHILTTTTTTNVPTTENEEETEEQTTTNVSDIVIFEANKSTEKFNNEAVTEASMPFFENSIESTTENATTTTTTMSSKTTTKRSTDSLTTINNKTTKKSTTSTPKKLINETKLTIHIGNKESKNSTTKKNPKIQQQNPITTKNPKIGQIEKDTIALISEIEEALNDDNKWILDLDNTTTSITNKITSPKSTTSTRKRPTTTRQSTTNKITIKKSTQPSTITKTTPKPTTKTKLTRQTTQTTTNPTTQTTTKKEEEANFGTATTIDQKISTIQDINKETIESEQSEENKEENDYEEENNENNITVSSNITIDTNSIETSLNNINNNNTKKSEEKNKKLKNVLKQKQPNQQQQQQQKQQNKNDEKDMNKIPEAEEEEQAGDISQLQLDSTTISTNYNTKIFPQSKLLNLPTPSTANVIAPVNRIIDGIGPLILPLLGYSRRALATYNPARAAGVSTYQPDNNGQQKSSTQQKSVPLRELPEQQLNEMYYRQINVPQKQQQQQQNIQVTQQQTPPPIKLESGKNFESQKQQINSESQQQQQRRYPQRYIPTNELAAVKQTNSQQRVELPSAQQINQQQEYQQQQQPEKPQLPVYNKDLNQLRNPKIPDLRERIINAETELNKRTNLVQQQQQQHQRYMPEPLGYFKQQPQLPQQQANPSVFASDVIRQALSKILNRDNTNNNNLQQQQQEIKENYYPAKFDEFIPLEGYYQTSLPTPTNSNALRMAPKTVSSSKSDGPDSGYDQGRNGVNSNFYEDSGVMINDNSITKSSNSQSSPPLEAFGLHSIEGFSDDSGLKSSSNRNISGGGPSFGSGFGGGRKPSSSFDEININ